MRVWTRIKAPRKTFIIHWRVPEWKQSKAARRWQWDRRIRGADRHLHAGSTFIREAVLWEKKNYCWRLALCCVYVAWIMWINYNLLTWLWAGESWIQNVSFLSRGIGGSVSNWGNLSWSLVWFSESIHCCFNVFSRWWITGRLNKDRSWGMSHGKSSENKMAHYRRQN